MEIDFRANDGLLKFNVAENRWARVFVRTSPRNTECLGAEDYETALAKLRAVLARPSELQYTLDHKSLSWAWIMSLSENHGSLYCREADGGLVFLALDARKGEKARFYIDSPTISEWLAKIDQQLE